LTWPVGIEVHALLVPNVVLAPGLGHGLVHLQLARGQAHEQLDVARLDEVEPVADIGRLAKIRFLRQGALTSPNRVAGAVLEQLVHIDERIQRRVGVRERVRGREKVQGVSVPHLLEVSTETGCGSHHADRRGYLVEARSFGTFAPPSLIAVGTALVQSAAVRLAPAALLPVKALLGAHFRAEKLAEVEVLGIALAVTLAEALLPHGHGSPPLALRGGARVALLEQPRRDQWRWRRCQRALVLEQDQRLIRLACTTCLVAYASAGRWSICCNGAEATCPDDSYGGKDPPASVARNLHHVRR